MPCSRSSSRASSSVPTTWNAKSLSIRVRTPSPGGLEQLAQPKVRSSTGSAARANRSRWKARSTMVATHHPVIGSLRSSNRPDAMAASVRRHERCVDGGGESPGEDRRGALDRGGGRWANLAALASDRGRDDAGHATRVDELEIAEVDRDVESDAVIADAALDAQAQGADLARRRPVRVDPAAGVAVASCRVDPVRGARRDQG